LKSLILLIATYAYNILINVMQLTYTTKT